MMQLLAQNPWEFAAFLGMVKGRSLLEIGSRYGESLKAMALRMPPWSRVVSVDLGHDVEQKNEDTISRLKENVAELARAYDVHLLLGDSHDAGIVEEVRKLKPLGSLYDVCFIDGDHSDTGIMEDWKQYGPMSNIVAFHDIKLAKNIWAEIKHMKRFMEIVHSDSNHEMGIGVIFNHG